MGGFQCVHCGNRISDDDPRVTHYVYERDTFRRAMRENDRTCDYDYEVYYCRKCHRLHIMKNDDFLSMKIFKPDNCND